MAKKLKPRKFELFDNSTEDLKISKQTKNNKTNIAKSINSNRKPKVDKFIDKKQQTNKISFCLRIPEENYNLLQAAAMSQKGNKGNITAYINELISRDIKNNHNKYKKVKDLLNS